MVKFNTTQFRCDLRGAYAAGVCLSMGLLLACGSGEPAPSSTTSSSAPAASPAVGGDHDPVIESVEITPSRPMVGGMVEAHVEARDRDGDELRYAYEWRLDGARTGDGDAKLKLSEARKGESLELWVTVSDGQARVTESTWVSVENAPPVVNEVLLEVSRGGMLVAVPRGNDRDGDSIDFSYRWIVDDDYVDTEGPSIAMNDYRMGALVEVEVMASDGESESAALRSEPYLLRNNRPVITSRPSDVHIVDERSIHYQVEAEDPDQGQRLRYRLEEGPEGMEIDMVLGELSWTPRAEQEGEFPVRVIVEDMNGGKAVQAFTVSATGR